MSQPSLDCSMRTASAPASRRCVSVETIVSRPVRRSIGQCSTSAPGAASIVATVGGSTVPNENALPSSPSFGTHSSSHSSVSLQSLPSVMRSGVASRAVDQAASDDGVPGMNSVSRVIDSAMKMAAA